MNIEIAASVRNTDILSVGPAGILPADERAQIAGTQGGTGRMPVGRTGWKPMLLE